MEPLIVPGNLDSLGILRQYVQQAADHAGLAQEVSYDLCLAVDEIATNTIVHGYDEQGISGEITVLARETADRLVIILEDIAPPFDPRSLRVPPAEDLLKPLEERQIGGLGVFLAMQNVDLFDYERVQGRNRNIFMMRKDRVS